MTTEENGWMNTEELSEFIFQKTGARVTIHTLQTWRTRGGGPPFHRFGKFVCYDRANSLEWIREKLGKPVHSTSELEARRTRAQAA
jgi:hypothetical protein